MQDYNVILQHMAEKGLSLWRGVHSSGQYQVPTAIVGNSEADSVFELSSIVTDTRFDFDDQVINSKAYRRALGNLRQAQSHPGELDNNSDSPERALHDLRESRTNSGHGDEATSAKGGFSPEPGFEGDLSEDRLAASGTFSVTEEYSAEPARTPSREEEAEEYTTKVLPSVIPSRSRPLPAKLGTPNLEDSQAPTVEQGPGSGAKNPMWSDWMSGLENKSFQSLPPEDGQVGGEQQGDLSANDEKRDSEQGVAPSTAPDISIVEPPPLAPPTASNIGSSNTFPDQAESIVPTSEGGLKEDATSPNAVTSSRLQSPTTEQSKLVQKTVVTPSPKKSSSRLQRFLSGLRQPSPVALSSEVPKIRTSGGAEIRRKLVIVGDTMCGKTALLIVFSKGTFPEVINVPTIFENYVADVEVDAKHVELALWDTAGMYDYDRLRPLSYPDSHVILLCFSVANKDSWYSIQDKVWLNLNDNSRPSRADQFHPQWLLEVLHFNEDIPILLIGMQVDCRDGNGRDPYGSHCEMVTTEEGEDLRKMVGAFKYLECSARTKKGVREVFEYATRASLRTRRKKKR